MGKIILMVLGLATYGAHSLVEALAPEPALTSPTAQETAEPSLAEGLTDSAVSAMLGSAGLTLTPHPAGGEGCGQSILSAAQLQELVRVLPPEQQTLLANVLNTSAPIWTAQLYTGLQGYGICLPMQERVLLVPEAVQQQFATLLSALPR